jgi:hypothetical protein
LSNKVDLSENNLYQEQEENRSDTKLLTAENDDFSYQNFQRKNAAIKITFPY